MRASFKSEQLVLCQICDMHNCMSNTNYECPAINRFPLKTADQILCKTYHRIFNREVCNIHILTVILELFIMIYRKINNYRGSYRDILAKHILICNVCRINFMKIEHSLVLCMTLGIKHRDNTEK